MVDAPRISDESALGVRGSPGEEVDDATTEQGACGAAAQPLGDAQVHRKQQEGHSNLLEFADELLQGAGAGVRAWNGVPTLILVSLVLRW